jgi:hypothetical protein
MPFVASGDPVGWIAQAEVGANTVVVLALADNAARLESTQDWAPRSRTCVVQCRPRKRG